MTKLKRLSVALLFVALAAVVASSRRPLKDDTAKDPEAETRQGLAQELTLAYASTAPASTIVRTFELTAAPTSVPQFDGRLLDVWAYNDQVPGPVLRVRIGESIAVKLRNRLPQPTTIHWHGVRVPNAMDGVPGVTQDPVRPGGSFTYRFTPKDVGTFWFHPHVRTSEQVERGLYGVLIVDDADPLPYDRDEVWVLDDWRLGPDGQIDPRFVTRHDLAHDGRWGQSVTVSGDANQELMVRPGERIRLRLVNTSNGRVYRPDFSELEARVIAVDGMYTRQPLQTDGFELAPGNRLDLDITIPLDAAGQAFQIVDRFTRRPFLLATLRVEGAAVATPTFAP
ncbi:MAG: multicopper oxidase domain-containing protein, partial [Myxococcales bacterium]|nr:multicopper oxidase domain-containing protein [Myxococcales bacterium]